MEEVINNDDLRKLIFSYLRKEPKKSCSDCNKVCVWDKMVNPYVEYPAPFYIKGGKSKPFCIECWRKEVPLNNCLVS